MRFSEEIEIDRAPADVWSLVGEVGDIGSWLPFLAESEAVDGGCRVCQTTDGGTIRERIVEHDSAARRYTYVIDEAPMPIEHNTSTIEVVAEGGGSRVIWTTEVEPAELAQAFAPIYKEGLANLKSTLES